jgi:hypothetical protein
LSNFSSTKPLKQEKIKHRLAILATVYGFPFEILCTRHSNSICEGGKRAKSTTSDRANPTLDLNICDVGLMKLYFIRSVECWENQFLIVSSGNNRSMRAASIEAGLNIPVYVARNI